MKFQSVLFFSLLTIFFSACAKDQIIPISETATTPDFTVTDSRLAFNKQATFDQTLALSYWQVIGSIRYVRHNLDNSRALRHTSKEHILNF